MPNRSPWIHQLNHERKIETLNHDLTTDVAVIGAGIAGVATAFFLLKHTDKKVSLIEGYKLAHGATGHNAGQLVTYFEKPFTEIVAEFGIEMACEAQQAIDSTWSLLDEIYTEAGLDIPMARFESYAGLSTVEQVIHHLENDALRRSGGLMTEPVEIWEDAPFLPSIPEKYHKQIQLISRAEIALKLETLDPQYIAILSGQKGVMNSALFCQEVISYLLNKYPERLALYELTQVKKVVVHADKILLDADRNTVEAAEVVLCTNGFENFDIITPDGLSVNTRFHHNLLGVVNFMSGYLEDYTGVPSAISYFPHNGAILGDPAFKDNSDDPYFYVTRRPYEYERGHKHNLICIGGPEIVLEKRSQYDRDLEFSEKAEKQIKDFVYKTYDKPKEFEHHFMWHGVMGYTKNYLRMVGPDPIYSHLYYNLGCNGVGLMPSIYGGSKVARQVKGETFSPSIFDISKT